MLLFGTLFVLVAIIAAYAIRHSAGAGYAIAAFLAIVAEGVWSADNVKPATLTTALVIYAAFALLFLGGAGRSRAVSDATSFRSGR